MLLSPIHYCGDKKKRMSESERFAHIFDKSIGLVKKTVWD